MSRYALILAIQFISAAIFGQSEPFKQLNSHELSNMLSKGNITLIDVRTPGEFENGHLTDAGQINYYALDFKKKSLLKTDMKRYIIWSTASWNGTFMISQSWWNLMPGRILQTEWSLMSFKH